MNAADDPVPSSEAPGRGHAVGAGGRGHGGQDAVDGPHPAEVVETRALDPGIASDEPDAGRELAMQLEQDGDHPVLVFGTSGAGTSTLLASLFACTRAGGAGAVRARAGPSPSTSGRDPAMEFFQAHVARFLEGEAPPPGRASRVVVLPVVLESPHLPDARFAFVECKGLVECSAAGSDRSGRRLPRAVSTFLREYPRAISVLHVAPCTHAPTWTEASAARRTDEAARRRAADLELAAMIDAYRAVRVLQHQDAHLFLLTKWDAHAPPGPRWSRFAAPELAEVIGAIRERYPRAFAAFLSVPGDAARRRQVLQYCAALLSGRSIVRAGAELQQQIDRYPRVLWSWLHANANGDARIASRLFPPEDPSRPAWLDRLDRAVSKGLRLLGV